MKLTVIADTLKDYVNSERLSLVVTVVQMIVVLLFVNHFVACLWFAVSDAQDGTTWIDHYGFRMDWQHQYVVAFHWSITQFTPSSMHVQPQNIPERITAICIVVFALVGFSYILGSISGTLAQLRQMTADKAKQFWSVRKYLQTRHVPRDLAVRVRRHLEFAFERQTKTSAMTEVKLFSLLSGGLRSELHCHHYFVCMSSHPFYWYLGSIFKVTAQRLASTAVEERYHADEDLIFQATELATHMQFLVDGLIRYRQASPDAGGEHFILEVDSHLDAWISEPVLWVESWRNLGDLAAVLNCNMLLLSPNGFCETMHQNPEAYVLALTYAQNFIKWQANADTTASDIVLAAQVCDTYEDFLEVPQFAEMRSQLHEDNRTHWKSRRR